jgi:ABC-type phosphate transport system substrate-binding protein
MLAVFEYRRRHAVTRAGRCAAAAQDSFILIVNSANPVSALRETEVSKLFLGKVTKWPNGKPVQPVDQVASSPARRKFSDAIHRMDVPSVKSYWQKIVFSGRGDPPPERASDEDIVLFVKANPNAIGYVRSSMPLVDVKILTLARAAP